MEAAKKFSFSNVVVIEIFLILIAENGFFLQHFWDKKIHIFCGYCNEPAKKNYDFASRQHNLTGS